MRQAIIFFVFFIFSIHLRAQPLKNITPRPVAVQELKEAGIPIQNGYSVAYDVVFSPQAGYLLEQLKNQCGIQLNLSAPTSRNKAHIILQHDTFAITKEEMYRLEIRNKKVTLKARSVRGIINGMQTLLQLFPLQQANSVTLPACIISDYPRFSYRGMHLDVVRHFFPVSYIKKTLITSVFTSSILSTGT